MSSFTWPSSVRVPSTRLKRVMISRFTISRSANACAASSLALISLNCCRRESTNGSELIGWSGRAHGLQGEPLLGRQQPPGIEDDDGPLAFTHEETADVFGREAAHQRGRRGDGAAVDPGDIEDLVD